MFLEGVFNRLMRYRPYWYSLNLNSKWGMACCQIWLRVGVDNCGFRMYDFVKLKHIWRIEWAQFGSGPMMVPLGTLERNSVSLKPTLHESNKFTSDEFLYYSHCLSCPAQTQRVSLACIHNTGKGERKKKNCKKYKSLNFEQDSTTFLKINFFF